MNKDDYSFWTYEELRDSYWYEERVKYIMSKYMTSVDKDDMDYPPVEYWESGVYYE